MTEGSRRVAGCEMDERVWSELPEEIITMVMRFIPIPQLSRLRVVCKTWDALLKQPQFRTQVKAPTTYLFRTFEDVTREPDEVSWEICDPSGTARYMTYYLLKDDFVYENLEERFRMHETLYQRMTIAADKGLLCVLWTITVQDWRAFGEAIFVCNPITKSCRLLPNFFSTSEVQRGFLIPAVALVVADDMASFSLFVIQGIEKADPDRKRCFVFDSKTDAWQTFSQPPATFTPCHLVKVGSIIFVIFWDLSLTAAQRRHQGRYKLYSYDIHLDEWRDTGVVLPPGGKIPQLVSCSGRIFYVHFEKRSTTIGEILDVNREPLVRVVANVQGHPYTTLVPRSDSSLWSSRGGRWGPYRNYIGMGANIVALGTEQGCICLSSNTGFSMFYELNEEKWCHWPQRDPAEDRGGWTFGCSTSLTLCPVPAIDFTLA